MVFGQWTNDKGHSRVAFIVQHHGISEVDGFFKKYEATLTATKDDLSDAAFEMTIETASLNTELEMRDNHQNRHEPTAKNRKGVWTFKVNFV